jgi:regulator of replication initiation timing
MTTDITTENTADISPENVALVCADLRYHGDYEWHDRIWDTRQKSADMLEALAADRDRWAKNAADIARDAEAAEAKVADLGAHIESAVRRKNKLQTENAKLRAALAEIVAHYKLTSSRNPTMDRMAYEAREALQETKTPPVGSEHG